VRICVDLQVFNSNVLCEVHPIPKVEETLPQLAEAMVFSKLDSNNKFWQIPLKYHSLRTSNFLPCLLHQLADTP